MLSDVWLAESVAFNENVEFPVPVGVPCMKKLFVTTNGLDIPDGSDPDATWTA